MDMSLSKLREMVKDSKGQPGVLKSMGLQRAGLNTSKTTSSSRRRREGQSPGDASWATSLPRFSASLMAQFPKLAQVDGISESHCRLKKGLHPWGIPGALGRT